MRLLLSFILCGLIISGSFAQRTFVNYERDGGWNIGFNAGGTWQPKELIGNTSVFTKPYAGFGGGLTLGKSIYERPGALLAFDLRGRYLGGSNYGWAGISDSSFYFTGDSSGNSIGFPNYKMSFQELSLESVVTLHKLRERTGIILYGFGGLGGTKYKVESDLKDGLGNYNDYSNIDLTQAARDISEDLRNQSDLNFETTVRESRWSFVPSLGFGLGFQVTPSFSVGVEHKVAYDVLGDEFDGGAINNLADNRFDKYHYTALNFRWNLLKPRPTYTTNNNNDIDNWSTTPTTNANPTPTPTPVTTGQKPLVNIYNPSSNNRTVHSASYTIKAKVYNVNSANNVTFKQNGLTNSQFSYNPNTNEFVALVYLSPGNNVFEIIGHNEYGNDQDSRIIILEQQVNQLPPPIVSISNPSGSSDYVTQPNFTILASVLNVNSKSNVTFMVNGVNTSNFSFNTTNKALTAGVTLQPGNNTITIKGTNSFGSDAKSVVIKYEQPAQVIPPVVTINVPNSSPYNTFSPVEVMNATVLNVASKNDIKVLINGNNTSNFTYNSNTKGVSLSANLIIGSNVIQVTGTNSAGVDTKSTTIVYRPSEVVSLPVVDFVFPNASPYSSQANNMTLKATVLNVSSHSNINVTFNGAPLNSFTFNSITKEVAFNVNLIDGNNLFKVTGTNSSGSDSDEQIVVHKLISTPQPPIVNITNPGSNPHNTSNENQIINAEIINVTNVSGVSAKFNGVNVTNFTFDPVYDKFVYNADLLVGANVLEVTGTNAAGTASKSQTIIYTPAELPCEDPTIELSQPQNLAKATLPVAGNGASHSVTVNTTNNKGSILAQINNATKVEFMVNGNSTPGFNYNNNTGAFESFLHLEEGANAYQILATNDCGTFIYNVTFIYTPEELPCDNPAVHFISPLKNPYNYSGPDKISFSVNVLGVTVKSQNLVKLNGNSIPFAFNSNGNIITGSLDLIEGPNNLLVTATNDCGTTTESIVINYSKPLPLPQVTITEPSNDPYKSTEHNVQLKAKVLNVGSKSNIQVLVDGLSIKNFNYSATSKLLTASLNLAEGSHDIIVRGTNTSGTDSDETEIIIEEECLDPTIVIAQPKKAAKSMEGEIRVETDNNKGAIIANIQHATQLSFKINGLSSQAYNFNPNSGEFVSYLHLKEGVSTYEIMARNACGIINKKIVYTYHAKDVPCDLPTLQLLSPSQQNSSTAESSINIKVKLTNVSNGDLISVKLNGSAVGHSFNSKNGELSTNINLIHGANSIHYTISNACGEINYDMTIIKSGGGNQTLDQNGNTNDQAYAAKIAAADKFFKARSYQKSLLLYHDALSLKPNELYPQQKILEIENILNAQKQQEAEQEKLEKLFNSHIQKGDLYFKAGKYSTAKTYYTKALGLKPNATYPKMKIADINNKIKVMNNVKPVNSKPTSKPINNKPVNNTNIGKGSTGSKGTSSGGSKGSTNSKGSSSGSSKGSTSPAKIEVTPVGGKSSGSSGRGGK